MKKRLNWRPDKPDFRDFHYHQKELLHPMAQKATVADLRLLMPPVVDQGEIGSCTGNAIAGALGFIELQELRDKHPIGAEVFDPHHYAPISRLYIYYNERRLENTTHEDSGAEIRDGIKSIRQWGVCREVVWPYLDSHALQQPSTIAYNEGSKHIVPTGFRIGNFLQMKSCLLSGYPFVFGFMVYDSFMSDSVATTGVVPMPDPSESIQGGHAVLAVGFNDTKKQFIVRNSWGPDWGDKGYFYMPYDYVTSPDLCDDFWTVRR